MKIPTLETEHLSLRPWEAGDAPALFTILQETDIFRYFPPGPSPTLERTARYIAHQLEHWQQFGYGHWAVVSREQGQLVGWNGLEYLPELGQVEVAYLLSQAVRGRGYATQAARAALRFGFETCLLPAIIGLVHPDNHASIRVLQKCGLTPLEPVTLWGLEFDRYGITRPEFDRQGGSGPL